VVGEQRDVVGPARLVAAEHVEVGAVEFWRLADTRRLAMTGALHRDAGHRGKRDDHRAFHKLVHGVLSRSRATRPRHWAATADGRNRISNLKSGAAMGP